MDPIEPCISLLKNKNKYGSIHNNSHTFPLQFESLVFRSEVYKSLKNLKFNKVKNLTQSQEFYLKKF